jgi:hypothetical protein
MKEICLSNLIVWIALIMGIAIGVALYKIRNPD